MTEKEKELNAKANAAAKKAAEILTPAQNYAIAIAGKNLKVGSFWGFTTMSDVKEYYEQIKGDENMNVRPLSKEVCIVEVNPQYILKSVLAVDDTIFSQSDIERIEINLTQAQVEFEKYLINKGITDNGTPQVVAIYCTNQVTTLVNKGIAYPAFRLSLEHALSLLGAYGYQVRVGNAFLPVDSVANDAENWKQLWSTMVLSPTKTGVFIEIQSTGAVDEYKSIRKKMKQATK